MVSYKLQTLLNLPDIRKMCSNDVPESTSIPVKK